MFNSEKEFLFQFGWDEHFASVQPVSSSLRPGRVICEERNLYRVQWGPDQTLWSSVSGKLQFQASVRADYPAVGDWVWVEIPENPERGLIQQIAPRKSLLQRKQIGASADAQILSTNVDYVFITTAVNELKHRRVERYLTVVWEAKALPVILLTKADLHQDIAVLIEEIKREFPGVAVHALSQRHFVDADFLQEYLSPGKTSVFIGSSGVGKSTLVNYLIGHEQIKTQEVRESDGKGRHTTTSRHLYQSRFGGLVIDTPGMRELQLADHVEGLSAQFADVEELMGQCRFSDCQHQTEPGCALSKALEDGVLSEQRWFSYRKLAGEIRHGKRKQSKFFAAEERKQWKKLSLQSRNRRKFQPDWG